MRKNVIITQLKNKLEELSGIEMMDVSPEMSFLQIGLDSLLLTQVALVLKNEFKVPISFRQLNEDLTSLDALASYIQSHGSPVEPEAVSSNGQALPIEKTSTPVSNPLPEAFSQIPVVANGSSPSVLGLVAQQIQLLGQQVALLSGQRMEVPSATSTLPSSAEGKEEAVQFSKKKKQASSQRAIKRT